MFYNKVELCGVNTSKLKTLTDEEKTELLRLTKRGDKRAREELIAGNLRLVLSIIQRFTTKTGEADDLFQVGCIGLIKAIDNFDVDIGVKFSTYAVPMIIGEIRRYLRDNNMLRVSRGTRDLAYRALSEREALASKMVTEPSVRDIALSLGETEKAISEALEAIMAPVSLYDPVYGENGDSLYVMDQICDEEASVDSWLENIAINEAMKKLTDRERAIIRMRFYRGKTQMEIAAEIGISQAQVSRIEKSALERIRKEM
ncbi:MAG: RNA polymerase sporulation sigma factor SigG [Clostridia bacterium]|nr:RNA polymerase sporulation sigma factor SigG [Clostridia bacterium]